MKTSVTILIIFFLCLIYGCNEKANRTQKKADTSERESGTVLVNGVELNYFIEGDGFPCIVVTEGELIAKSISNELKDHFTFIFINARMNVSNPGEIDKISFDMLIEDVDQVRRVLNLEKVCVFGHSISGLIALEYARKFPQYTSHVIMNGTPPYVNEHFFNFRDTNWESNASEERKMSLINKWGNTSSDSLNNLGTSEAGKLSYILDGPKCWYNYNYDPSPLLSDTYWNMRVWDQIFNNLMTNYDLERGDSIEVPVFLALGKYDYLVPFTMWNDQKDKIPNLSYNLYEKSSHWAFFEEKKLFSKDVIEWFEKTKE